MPLINCKQKLFCFKSWKQKSREKLFWIFLPLINFKQIYMHDTKIKTVKLKWNLAKRETPRHDRFPKFISQKILTDFLSNLQNDTFGPQAAAWGCTFAKKHRWFLLWKLLLHMSRFAQLLLGEGMSLVCNISKNPRNIGWRHFPSSLFLIFENLKVVDFWVFFFKKLMLVNEIVLVFQFIINYMYFEI